MRLSVEMVREKDQFDSPVILKRFYITHKSNDKQNHNKIVNYL